jgi:predicted transcriptional regulator
LRHISILFWDNPKAGLALVAQHIQSFVQQPVKKTIHSKESAKLSAALRAAREAAGMTQQQVAKELDKPQSFVAKYELGERRLDVIEFLKITRLLNANPTKILKSLL